ncbi:MAG TPA: MraY family glycosyltransferase [Candidatus Hydrogenedens sp.]|nr:MraY family glycosyltransferase [Candidatus Hydrogenedens sp.]HOL19195.1 MraY family glycosyltransferase [Candidatus Hydrogenedens sp.]HPP58411.1 MraY family glycosyltransferase [Candidatus Hydrogenedens sp.]
MKTHDWAYVTVFALSFLCTLILVPIFRWLAMKLGIYDVPNESRKVHKKPIPYLGGLAFYITYLLACLFVECRYPQYFDNKMVVIGIGGTFIVLMGVLDDLISIPASKKLVIELIFGIILFFWGFQVTTIAHPLGGTINVGPLALVITVLWIVGVTNAINIVDGLDGLASGLVAISSLTIFTISYSNKQILSCLIMSILLGCTIAFLIYNSHPASVFMGDAGALFLGFVLGCATLVERKKGVTIVALTVPIVVLAVPFLDTFLSFLRRMRRPKEVGFFASDKDCIYHRLLRLGLSQRQVVFSLYYFSICMGFLAYITSLLPSKYAFLVLILVCMMILMGVIILHFVENIAGEKQNQNNNIQG